MTIKQFIEKAIEGGYDGYPEPFCIECGNYEAKTGGDLFLDPKAWEAVGKVEGWGGHNHPLTGKIIAGQIVYCWECKMHQMIDALISGKTLEEYIETL